MNIKKIVKLFEKGNVCVTGLRGCGKDMLFGNVIMRRKKMYLSNLDYGGDYIPLDITIMNCGLNTYTNFIENNINYYEWAFEEYGDIYLSDCGVYFPSQYCNYLNNKYGYIATYQALSRQVSHNNVHINCQNLNRVWDKIREQSDIYIRCNWCKVLFNKLVIQKITIYDKYESCLNRVNPCRIHVPLFANSQIKQNARLYLDNFYNTHGEISSHILIYFNKSTYDTYYFEKLLKNGKKKGE